jgi:hypothetical protein
MADSDKFGGKILCAPAEDGPTFSFMAQAVFERMPCGN